MNKKFIFISFLILLTSIFCMACNNTTDKELSIDDVYTLLGEARSSVYKRLNIAEDEIKYPFSEEMDPYKQYEELTSEKILEGQRCIFRLRFSPYNGNDILRDLQCIFICREDSGYDPEELYIWTSQLYAHLDKKWQDQAWASPTGDTFDPVDQSEFLKGFSKYRIWNVGEHQTSYMLSYDVSPEYEGQPVPAVSVMFQLVNL